MCDTHTTGFSTKACENTASTAKDDSFIVYNLNSIPSLEWVLTDITTNYQVLVQKIIFLTNIKPALVDFDHLLGRLDYKLE